MTYEDALNEARRLGGSVIVAEQTWDGVLVADYQTHQGGPLPDGWEEVEVPESEKGA